jgi:3-phosphoshikimate 1-carboxyvinyltransferase
MAFTVASLLTEEDVTLDHPECVTISYPEFYQDFQKIMQ